MRHYLLNLLINMQQVQQVQQVARDKICLTQLSVSKSVRWSVSPTFLFLSVQFVLNQCRYLWDTKQIIRILSEICREFWFRILFIIPTVIFFQTFLSEFYLQVKAFKINWWNSVSAQLSCLYIKRYCVCFRTTFLV